MKYLILTVLFLSISLISNAQNLDWVRKMGGPLTDAGKDIIVDSNGNVYTIGTYQNVPTVTTNEGTYNLTSYGSTDIFISKNDSNGTFLWIRTLGSSLSDDISSIEFDANSNLLMTARFQGTIDANPGVGVSSLTSNGGSDVFILKLDSDGNFIWVKQFGGTASESINSIVVDTDQNIIVGGIFNSTVDFDPGLGIFNLISTGGQDGFVCKLNSSGDFIWAKNIGSPNTQNYEILTCVALDQSNNIVITGNVSGTLDFDPNAGVFNLTSGGLFDTYILKLNSNGDFVFAKKTNGANAASQSSATKIVVDNSGNILATGTFYNPMDFDPSPAVFTMTSIGFNNNIYLLKLQNDGDFIWAKQMPSGSVVSISGFEIDAYDNYYLTGHFETNLDFDPSAASYIKTSAGGRDIYFCKLDSSAQLIWGHAIGGTGFDMGLSITTDLQQNVHVTGYFYNTVDFNPGVGVFNLTNGGSGGEAYILKLGNCEHEQVTDTVTACGSYTWINGQTYTSSNNTVFHVLTNQGGCDSIVYLHLTIKPNSYNFDTIISCGPYTWIDGNTYYVSTSTPTFTLTNHLGCDSIISLNLTVNSPSFVVNSVSTCDSYTWIDGVNYTSSTNLPQFTLTNSNGCDSIINLHLSINYSTSSIDSITACGSYTWINCVTYSSSVSNVTHIIPNSVGCDSIITLNLTILPVSNSIDSIIACGSYTWIDGITYFTSTFTPTFSLQNQYGCDSIISLHLTINPVSNTINTISACNSYTWIDGNTYSSSTTSPSLVLTNSFGCDSIISLDLTINHSTSSTQTIASCSPFTWINGQTYLNSINNVSHIIPNSVGCDSIITLDLTILPSSTSTQNITACGSYTWINGVTYNSSNSTATHLLTNSAGCDSLVSLNLTINQAQNTYHFVETCSSYTWINGTTYSSSTNTPIYVLQTNSGCDSIVHLNLTVSSIDTALTINGNEISSNQNGAIYQWIDCANGGQAISGETNQLFVATTDGDYAVIIHLGNCEEYSRCVTINSQKLIENNLNQLEVYPNPTTDIVNIITDLELEKIQVINSMGQVVSEQTKHEFSIKTLSPGVYSLKIKTNLGFTTRLIVKQ